MKSEYNEAIKKFEVELDILKYLEGIEITYGIFNGNITETPSLDILNDLSSEIKDRIEGIFNGELNCVSLD